jgi:hypothetical protein
MLLFEEVSTAQGLMKEEGDQDHLYYDDTIRIWKVTP